MGFNSGFKGLKVKPAWDVAATGEHPTPPEGLDSAFPARSEFLY